MNCYEEKVITEVESIRETKYFREFIEAFQNIKKSADDLGNKKCVLYAEFEIELLLLYGPIIRMKSQKELKFNFIEDLDDNDLEKLKKESIKYFETRLKKTENYFLKYIYLDYLFENQSESTLDKYPISIYLYDSLIELISYYQMKNDNQYVDYIGRFIEICLSMNNREKLQQIVERMRPLLRENISNRDYLVVPKLSENYRKILESKFSEVTPDDMKKEWIHTLQSIRVDSFSNNEYDWHRRISEELIGYRRFDLISEAESYKLNLEIGAGYEKEAEHQYGREHKTLMGKIEHLNNALKHYLDVGETSKVNEMKLIIRRLYAELSDSDEMQTFEFKFSVPQEIINHTINQYIKEDNKESLEEISSIKLLCPYDIDMEEAEEFSILDFVSLSVMDDGKKIAESVTDEERQRIKLARNYTQLINFRNEMIMTNIFTKLIEKYSLSTEDLMNQLDLWGHLNKKNRPFIEKGFERFFNNDYLSALHILVPQYESVFKLFFEKSGVPITTMKEGTTQQTQTFNAFLEREEVVNYLDSIDLLVIKFIMVEALGFNLRNNIAHGLTEEEDMTFSNCVLVIYLYLLLTSYDIIDNTADC